MVLGGGKVRNKTGTEQRMEGGQFVREGRKLMLLPELKSWVSREICCCSYWKQKISCVSLWFFLCVSFSTQGAIVLQC